MKGKLEYTRKKLLKKVPNVTDLHSADLLSYQITLVHKYAYSSQSWLNLISLICDQLTILG